MNQTITISHADRAIDYTLDVAFEFRPGSPARMGWGSAGDPGEAPRVEIETVRCVSYVVWHDKHADEVVVPRRPFVVGGWCLENLRAEIEEELLKGMGAAVYPFS